MQRWSWSNDDKIDEIERYHQRMSNNPMMAALVVVFHFGTNCIIHRRIHFCRYSRDGRDKVVVVVTMTTMTMTATVLPLLPPHHPISTHLPCVECTPRKITRPRISAVMAGFGVATPALCGPRRVQCVARPWEKSRGRLRSSPLTFSRAAVHFRRFSNLGWRRCLCVAT